MLQRTKALARMCPLVGLVSVSGAQVGGRGRAVGVPGPGSCAELLQLFVPCLRQGVDPVLRTYNTLIIACNMCGQPHEVCCIAYITSRVMVVLL